MGADGGMSGPVARGNLSSSCDVPLLPQYLSLEPINLANQKYMRSGELRRALGLPLVSVSEDHMFRVSSSKPYTPVATEDLRLFKESVSNASIKATERMKMLSSSINKLDKYIEDMGLKWQRADLSVNEKPSIPTLSKTVCQPSRNFVDQSVQRMEDRAKRTGVNKRFRSSTVDKIDSKPVSVTKDQMTNEKDKNVTKSAIGDSVQPQERIPRVSAVGEGWENKHTKRRRSIGICVSKLSDNDSRRALHTKQSIDTKLTSCDNPALRLSGRPNVKQGTSARSPDTVIKARSRGSRTVSVIATNISDVQASETSEVCKKATSTSKTISLGLMQNQQVAANSSPMLGQWIGQRQQKSSRGRRSNVVSPVLNHDKVQISSISISPVSGVRSTLNDDSGCLDTHNRISESKVGAESTSPPGLLSEGEGLRGAECVMEDKEKDTSDVAMNGKGKVRDFVIPTKRNKNFQSEIVTDGLRRQGRTVRGFSLSKPGISQSELNLENMSMMKRTQNTSSGSQKIRSKSGKPPAKRMSNGRVEFDDDHEELLAAAASARNASYLSCSGRFWKKMEPVFSSISPRDLGYLKQQLIFAEEMEANQSVIPGADNKFLGVLVHKERADALISKKGSKSNVVGKDEASPTGKRLDKYSSLYQRVLSALIKEDENEGLYNGYEGGNMSIQCASDDSHCGSCNYADTETRDRDRFDSEAESMLDFPVQKRCPGDGFSSNKSVTSNTTWSTSLSDSLYSSGRWLGDDGLSYSDADFISGCSQNDIGGPQPLDITGTLYDCQYQLMCMDDRLMLELQSIGLYPDAMPDLTEGEEVIDQDITGLKEGLHKQIGKKKGNLVKIDRAIQDDIKMEKVYMEQVAMEQLIQMAYKRRMASRRNSASVTVMRRVSKQVAMGFIERTLARCKTFEVTGRSCFSEPALQDVFFAVPQSNDIVVNNAPASFGATNHLNTSRAGSCIDDLGRASCDSPRTASHSSEHGLPKLESVSHKGRKREILLDDVGAASSRGHGSLHTGRAKGKKNERNRESSRGSLMTDSMCENQSVGSFMNEEKSKAKVKNSASAIEPLSSSIQRQSTGNNKRSREIWLSSSGNDPVDACDAEVPFDIDSMMPLDHFNDPGAPDDLNAWLNMDELLDDNCDGLAIPMDDLSMVF